jgi:hypothetical protein
MTRMAIELLTIDQFSDKIGHPFVVEESDVPAVELTLTEVTALRNFANAPRAPFSLLFTSQGSAVMPQRMYAVRHEALGLLSFFLVPIAGTKEKVTYQAIFN